MEPPFRQPTPRERQRDRTRQRLFESALEEFRRDGFQAASIGRIAKRAGVSRTSFYFHFPTRDHVLLELQWRLELRIVDGMQRRDSLRSALEAFVDGLIEAEEVVGDPALYRDMFSIYARRPEGLPLDDQPFPVMVELARRFAAGVRQGELRKGLQPVQTAHLFLTSVFGYLIGTGTSPESRRADLEVLVSLYLSEPD